MRDQKYSFLHFHVQFRMPPRGSHSTFAPTRGGHAPRARPPESSARATTSTLIAARSPPARRPFKKKGQEFFERLLAVTSGARAQSELLGHGGAEFVPLQLGATL